MSDEKPSYLRAAFLNVYNLGLFGGLIVASTLSGEYVLGVAAAGAEALWLLFGPDLRPFRRAVDQAHRDEQERAQREQTKKLMEGLPERDWARAKALDDLRREIERDMQQNPSFQVILLDTEIDKLTQLHKSFVTLANACARAETYMSATDMRDLNRQIEIQHNLEKTLKDQGAQEIATKNIQVLEKRRETIAEIQNFLARARGQMNLIENTVRLLRDQVLTMQSPDQLGDQLDDLLVGVDAVQQSARDHEAIFSKISLEPIAPIESGDKASGSSQRVRN